MIKDSFYQIFCDERRRNHQERILRDVDPGREGNATVAGQDVINFSSNDYLGLSHHPMLLQRSKDYSDRLGVGATGSRLITGNSSAYAHLEQRLASAKGQESALIMSSGYQTNLTVLAALADADVIKQPIRILADRLCHFSLLQGIRLAGARLTRFQHNDMDHLEQCLRQQAGGDSTTIIVTESVFGMDGDRADLSVLVELSQTYPSILYVDEAHATGLFGHNGFGLAAEHKDKIDLVMGTFGKALGGFGSYVACSTMLRHYLIQRCGGFIYSTGLPPSVLGAIDAALEIIPSFNSERDYVQKQADYVRTQLRQQGWNCGVSSTQIIPVILGDELAASRLSALLLSEGILVQAIRPPTVPRGTSRLRLSLSAVHKDKDIERLCGVMERLASQFHDVVSDKAS